MSVFVQFPGLQCNCAEAWKSHVIVIFLEVLMTRNICGVEMTGNDFVL